MRNTPIIKFTVTDQMWEDYKKICTRKNQSMASEGRRLIEEYIKREG